MNPASGLPLDLPMRTPTPPPTAIQTTTQRNQASISISAAILRRDPGLSRTYSLRVFASLFDFGASALGRNTVLPQALQRPTLSAWPSSTRANGPRCWPGSALDLSQFTAPMSGWAPWDTSRQVVFRSGCKALRLCGTGSRRHNVCLAGDAGDMAQRGVR